MIIHRNYQQGSALITALLIMAIATLLATASIAALRLLINETTLNINNDQMYEYLLGANDWAQLQILAGADLKQLPPLNININGVNIRGEILPQQSLFNINSLATLDNEGTFIRLLQAVIPHMSLIHATRLAQAVNLYITPATSSDDAYLMQNPSYRPAHRLLTNISELRAVLGIDATIYLYLSPYITALPNTQNSIDINYAPLKILQSLNDKITLSQAQNLYNCRNKQGIVSTIMDFMKTCNPEQSNILDGLSTQENYYLLRATATHGDQQLILISFLKFTKDTKGNPIVKTIWQQLNIDS